jgi:hypothetical protein
MQEIILSNLKNWKYSYYVLLIQILYMIAVFVYQVHKMLQFISVAEM